MSPLFGGDTASNAAVDGVAWPTWPHSGERERELLLRALGEPWYGVGAPLVIEAEAAYRDFIGSRHAVSVTNGTISLELALRSLGIGSGDEVIVPPYTFYATATSVLMAGALPIFADLDPDSWCLDPAAAEAAITERTRAIIVVHLAGHAADLTAFRELCDRRGLALIEDAAHAHGSEWEGRRVGTIGEYSSWSFQGSKNLTAGEGGMLTTDDDALADAIKVRRNCGRPLGGQWYEHHELGGNYRITAFQAAIMLAGLERLPDQIARREESAAILGQRLADVPGLDPLPRDPRVTAHAFHLYPMRYRPEADAPTRDEVLARLAAAGVPSSGGYPMPLQRQRVFAEARFDRVATGWDPSRAGLDYGAVVLPVVESVCAEAVWLPHEVLLAEPERISDLGDALAEAVQGP